MLGPSSTIDPRWDFLIICSLRLCLEHRKFWTQLKFVVPHELLWFNLAQHKTNRILTLVHRNLFGTHIIHTCHPMCVSQATSLHNGSKQRTILAPCPVKSFTAQITCKQQNAETNAEQSLNVLQLGHLGPLITYLVPLSGLNLAPPSYKSSTPTWIVVLQRLSYSIFVPP